MGGYADGAPEILVADSDRVAGASTSDILRAGGYNVITVATFREAKRHIVSGCPALLIADVRLGEFNGLHLAWRRHFSHPGMPTIITDTAFDSTLKDEADRLGAVYLVKPIGQRELLKAVATLVEVSHVASTPTSPTIGLPMTQFAI
jgi:DNA-binding response OmpR family regulator